VDGIAKFDTSEAVMRHYKIKFKLTNQKINCQDFVSKYAPLRKRYSTYVVNL